MPITAASAAQAAPVSASTTVKRRGITGRSLFTATRYPIHPDAFAQRRLEARGVAFEVIDYLLLNHICLGGPVTRQLCEENLMTVADQLEYSAHFSSVAL
ncbi:hypothetical protein [Acerihabitans arboris]|uniref:Uncharacterized protein n=1 Tax=Acerihabitans arboris TaxID=2691583 RepID=A0A845SLI3_9GAMM|nr:hypothetical protein [Acerihabitans arboris]NDL64097.1 hypothetical protein [Acerihabitans arboris]